MDSFLLVLVSVLVLGLEGKCRKVEHENEDDDENDRKGSVQARPGALVALVKLSLMRPCFCSVPSV